MAEFAQVAHGFTTPQHALGPQLVRRIIVGRDIPAQPTVVLDAIPQWFSTLIIRVIAASDTGTGNVTNLQLTANDDNSSNQYAGAELHYIGGTGTGGSSTDNTTIAIVGQVPTNTRTVTRMGLVEIRIVGYAATVFEKTVFSRDYGMPNATASTNQLYLRGWSWRSTSAITRLTLSPALGNFVRDSQFDLLGEP